MVHTKVSVTYQISPPNLSDQVHGQACGGEGGDAAAQGGERYHEEEVLPPQQVSTLPGFFRYGACSTCTRRATILFRIDVFVLSFVRSFFECFGETKKTIDRIIDRWFLLCFGHVATSVLHESVFLICITIYR